MGRMQNITGGRNKLFFSRDREKREAENNKYSAIESESQK